MRGQRLCLLGIMSVVLAVSASAQREHRQPLSEAQVDKIREAGIEPEARIKLYTQFAGDRVDTIKGLTPRAHSGARSKRLDNELQDLTALMDELSENLDQYGGRKADLRKSLKALRDASKAWMMTLNSLPSEPVFDLSRKEAIDSGKDLADEVEQMLKEQTAYFELHKDEAGQDRAEPKN